MRNRALPPLAAILVLGLGAPSADSGRKSMEKIVAAIQRADYEGDRRSLASLAEEIRPYAGQGALATRARYWRGFALWRRALNGFNEKDADPKDLERDLLAAAAELAQVPEKDPLFADARSAAAGISWNVGWLNREDPELFQQYIAKGADLIEQAKKAAPDNPRVLWIVGGGQWYVPVERGGGQDKAIATYERALELARRDKARPADPLDPRWGEAELHMNLAWSQMSRKAPDLAAAERNARAAVALVPHWHYVRDILLPQILEAKSNPASAAAAAANAVSSAPSVGRKASASDFDFLEGSWAVVYNNSAPGVPPNLRGKWTGKREADGRVLSDEFRLLGPNEETVYLCTTYRVFDHVRGQWDMRFLGLTGPGPGEREQRIAQWAELTAWPEGSTIRVDQSRGDFRLRITYFDITKDRFRWKADVSSDGGKTWTKDQIRIEATRAR